MKFRVYNEYIYYDDMAENDEDLGYIKPVIDEGYKEVVIDYLGEHKNFYLRLANCMMIDDSREYAVPLGDGDNWIDLVNEKLFPLICEFGNLGCSSIKTEEEITDMHIVDQRFTYNINGITYTMPTPSYPIFEVKQEVISRRQPSRVVDGAFIVQPDFFEGYFDLEEVSHNPSLYKVIWDLKKMLTDYQQGKEVNLDILNAHLTQCNVISITERKKVYGQHTYVTVPHVDNLLGLAFWQFQQLLLENNPSKIAVCKMCGNYFEKRSHKGLFCNESITGAYGAQIKVNSCTSRFNSLKARVKKTYVSDAALTIDDLAKKHTKCSLELLEEFIAQWEAECVERIHRV